MMNAGEKAMDDIGRLTRRARMGLLTLLAFVAMPLVMMFTPSGAGWKGPLDVICILIMIFLPVGGFIVYLTAKARIRDIARAIYVPKAIGAAFGIEEYDPKRHIPDEHIDPALIRRAWESVNGGDYVRGEYRGLDFEFSNLWLSYEVTARRDSDSSAGTRTKTAFHGLWLVCSFPAGFPAELRLTRKGIRLLPGKSAEIMYLMPSGDEAVDKKFDIVTDSREGARELLTRRVIDAVIRLDEYTKGRCGLKFARDGILHIAVNSDRSLFVPARKPRDIERKITEDVRYVTEILNIVQTVW